MTRRSVMPQWPWRRILESLAALAAVFVVAEWSLRTCYFTPGATRFDPDFGIIDEPHLRVVNGREGFGVSRTNRLGFHDDEPAGVAPARRVLMLGDSYAVGLQVVPRQNLTKVAEEAWPGLDIANASQSGRSPADYAVLLEGHLRRFAPDLVVVQLNDGDLVELAAPDVMARSRVARVPEGGSKRLAGLSPGLARWARQLRRRSAVVQYASMRLSTLRDVERRRFVRKFGAMSVPTGPGLARLGAETLLDSLVGDIARRAPRLVLLYLPSMRYFDHPATPEDPAAGVLYREVAARHGIRIVDLTDVYLEEFRRTGQPCHGFSNTTIGTGHINARGHALAGTTLAQALREELP